MRALGSARSATSSWVRPDSVHRARSRLLVRSGDQIVAMDDGDAGGGMATLASLIEPYLSALT